MQGPSESERQVLEDTRWRYHIGDGPCKQKTRRVGLAWMEPDGEGWHRRRGRCPDGWLDEHHATAAAVAAMDQFAVELAQAAQHAREAAARKPTVRELAHEWLEWLAQIYALAARCPPSASPERGVVVDPEELAARAQEDRRDADAFRLLLFTGPRLGEVLALRWADVDTADRRRLVRRAVSAGRHGGHHFARRRVRHRRIAAAPAGPTGQRRGLSPAKV